MTRTSAIAWEPKSILKFFLIKRTSPSLTLTSTFTPLLNPMGSFTRTLLETRPWSLTTGKRPTCSPPSKLKTNPTLLKSATAATSGKSSTSDRSAMMLWRGLSCRTFQEWRSWLRPDRPTPRLKLPTASCFTWVFSSTTALAINSVIIFLIFLVHSGVRFNHLRHPGLYRPGYSRD